jgi:hypothetical protein
MVRLEQVDGEFEVIEGNHVVTINDADKADDILQAFRDAVRQGDIGQEGDGDQ